MIDLTEQQRQTVERILHAWVPDRRVVAFGSRVRGNPKPFSDLDLAIYSSEPLTLALAGHLRDAFSESDLPFRVDLADMATVSDEFRRVIEEECETMQKGV